MVLHSWSGLTHEEQILGTLLHSHSCSSERGPEESHRRAIMLQLSSGDTMTLLPGGVRLSLNLRELTSKQERTLKVLVGRGLSEGLRASDGKGALPSRFFWMLDAQMSMSAILNNNLYIITYFSLERRIDIL